MTRPDWMPKDSGGLVAELVATAEFCGVPLACLPHLRATAEELVTGKPSTLVEPIMHEAWRPTLIAVMGMVPVLLADTIVLANGPRLYGAMIVMLEAMTQTDEGAYDHAKAILNDVRELGDVLRDMQAARRAREQAKIAENAAVAVDPALTAELAKIDRLVVEELGLSLPLPLWAQLQTSTPLPDELSLSLPPSVQAELQASRDRTVSFVASGELAHVGALYRAWAPGAGWLLETVLDNDRHVALDLKREGVVIGLRLGTWFYDGRISIAIELPRPLAATVVHAPRPMVAPKLPPITRERLPALPSDDTKLDQPVALLADGGLLFVANEYDVWMIDPHTGQKTRVASKQGVRMRALVPDGAGLLAMSSTPVTLHHIGTDAAPVVVNDRAFGIALCCVDSTAFIGCDDGRILAVKLPTGEDVGEIGGFTKDLRALTRVESMLYALDGRVISSIDPVTFKVKTIIELPKGASALASDGKRLYTLHGSAIGAVDLAERSFTQIAGQPQLGALQMLAAGGGAARDGIGEGAVIEAARFLSHDAGNLWFTDSGRVRWFEIRAMHTRTLDIT